MEWDWLQALKQPVDIYFAEFKNAKDATSEPIGYFMYIDGSFRWDSGIRLVTPTFDPPPPPSNMIKMVYPAYPPKAKKKRVQGNVTLHVLIQKDGSVKILG